VRSEPVGPVIEPGLEPGSLVVRKQQDWTLLIERADPVIWVSTELLEHFSRPHVEHVSYGDGILTIRAVNGTVSYGVGAPVASQPGAFVARRSGTVADA
jgi:hypothetical protein